VLRFDRGFRNFLRDLSRGGKLRAIPATAEGFNQLDGGGHGLDPQISELLLVAEESGMRYEHVKILIDTGFIACLGQFEIALRRQFSLLLLLNFFGQNSNSGHGILHLLKSGQNSLPIAGDIRVVQRYELIYRGAAQACVKDALRGGGADGPKVARPVEQF